VVQAIATKFGRTMHGPTLNHISISVEFFLKSKIAEGRYFKNLEITISSQRFKP